MCYIFCLAMVIGVASGLKECRGVANSNFT